MKKVAVAGSIIVLAAVLMCGCAGMGKKSPEELAMQRSQDLINVIFAGEVDKVLDFISEDFTHYEVPDKATIADYIKMGKDMGYVGTIEDNKKQLTDRGMKIGLENAKATADKEKGTVTVYPIDASADMGSVTIEFTWKLDKDGVYRIVGADVEGI